MKHYKLMRWHVWLGWLIGVPIILWTASGLLMVARPIDEVRGEHLRNTEEPLPILYKNIKLFADSSGDIKAAELKQIDGRTIWVVTYPDGGKLRFDAATGSQLSQVSKDEARKLADAEYLPPVKIASITNLPGGEKPVTDFRNARPVWQVSFADGTNIYIDSDTGETLAVRTQFWRVFDFMWGIHIMDLQTREDTSHPVLIGFAAISLIGSVLGFVMLFTRRKRKKWKKV